MLSSQILADTNPVIEVTIDGVDEQLKDSLLTGLSIDRQKSFEKLTSASIKALYKRSSDEITSTLRSFGYYRPVITQSLQQQEDKWLANFNVDVGPPMIIRQVNVLLTGAGKDDAVLQKAVAAFPLKTGDQVNHAAYETGKKIIQNLAQHTGYFDAYWKVHKLAVDIDLNVADITLHFDSGDRYRYSEIKIPETVVQRSLLEKLLTIKVGGYYDASELVQMQQKLHNTSYFEQVEIIPEEPQAENKTLAVNVKLVEKKKNAYRAGVGFGTDTGPRLAGAWDSHYLNRRGHRLETDLRLSPVLSSLSSSYLIPFVFDREAELGITAAVSREDTDTSISNKILTSVQHIQSRWGWNETLSLSYQFEDFEIANVKNSVNLLVPGVTYGKTVNDDPLYTRYGYRLNADFRGAAEGFISDVSFLQLTLRGKYIYSVFENSRFITRTELGATTTSSFTNLPSSFRFFAGGDNSIRGFDFEALGPKNAQGDVLGGKYLAVGSLEYEHQVYEKWSVALFSDFGNAFNDFSDPLVYSVGTGLRWQSPVGLIRVDLAAGISEDDLPFRLHIVIGPDL